VSGAGILAAMRVRTVALVCLAVAACSAPEQVLHGKISQLTPAVCVAATRATGDCFDASSVPAGLRVGECVVVRYTPSDVPGRLARVRKIQKEPCS